MPNSRIVTYRALTEHDPMVRIWSELAIIEQGSVGIVRHLQSLIDQAKFNEAVGFVKH